MPATVRYDEQYCPIARALDVLGDRWTLLIIRELVISDQRFTELRRHLPGIAPTVLTQRLRTMAEQGLVSTATPTFGGRSVYTLTPRGRSAIPVMTALARWGMPLLEAPPDDHAIRAWTAVAIGVGNYYDAIEADGIDERYRLTIDGEDFTLSSVKGGGPPRDEPDLVLESAARLWIDIRQGRLTLGEAEEQGLVQVTGRRRALAHFQRIFHIA